MSKGYVVVGWMLDDQCVVEGEIRCVMFLKVILLLY